MKAVSKNHSDQRMARSRIYDVAISLFDVIKTDAVSPIITISLFNYFMRYNLLF
jgi:hypothetical protein